MDAAQVGTKTERFMDILGVLGTDDADVPVFHPDKSRA
jgi:hypothetical protein